MGVQDYNSNKNRRAFGLDPVLSVLVGMLLFVSMVNGQSNLVQLVSDEKGNKLLVDGREFMVNGMNWDYIPRGTNAVNANFWQKPDDIIQKALDYEMSLLHNMNVNAVRLYTGVPAKWIRYIYENHGIYTMLNHSFGRYGLTIKGNWVPVTDYADQETQELLLAEVTALVKEYQHTPGLLLYLLGNENNYGLFWAGAESEDFPEDEKEKALIGETRGRPMYRLMNTASRMIKELDKSHPVAICNGDVQFIDIIAAECTDVDIFGTNTYRGVSFGDLFNVVKQKLGKPLLLTEFGADAYNAVEGQEDQVSQAYYVLGNWKEVYQNAYGLGGANNVIGGFTFQFSDGWWKYGFNDRVNEEIHDVHASWSNGGYDRDMVPAGGNNMNEEWFGICGKGPTDAMGLYELYPRAAYYSLLQAHQLNPYGDGVTADSITTFFKSINIQQALEKAKENKTK